LLPGWKNWNPSSTNARQANAQAHLDNFVIAKRIDPLGVRTYLRLQFV